MGVFALILIIITALLCNVALKKMETESIGQVRFYRFYSIFICVIFALYIILKNVR